MTSAIAYAPVPIALFRGANHDCIVSSGAWQSLFGSQLPPALAERIAQVRRTKQAAKIHLRLRSRAYLTVLQPVPPGDIMVTCIDQTATLLAQAEAARSRRLREQVLAAVSHDLRAPLSTILLWERVLRERIDEVELRELALDAIRESATSQSRVIGDLAVVSGRIKPERDRIALESVLATAIEEQLATARAKQISFAADYQPRLGQVHADHARLQQAFAKVIETAVRISPSGTTIKVSARRKRGSIQVVIGQPELAARTRAREPVALELGLVVASELIAMHAGTFDVVRPYSGSVPTFSISLPALVRRTPPA